MLDMIHYKKLPFTELQANYQVQRSFPAIPVTNQVHLIPNSHLILLLWTFVLPSTVCGSTVSTVTGIYAGRSGFQILAGARELSLLQNMQTRSSAHPASNSKKTTALSLAVKLTGQTVCPLTSI